LRFDSRGVQTAEGSWDRGRAQGRRSGPPLKNGPRRCSHPQAPGSHEGGEAVGFQGVGAEGDAAALAVRHREEREGPEEVAVGPAAGRDTVEGGRKGGRAQASLKAPGARGRDPPPPPGGVTDL